MMGAFMIIVVPIVSSFSIDPLRYILTCLGTRRQWQKDGELGGSFSLQSLHDYWIGA